MAHNLVQTTLATATPLLLLPVGVISRFRLTKDYIESFFQSDSRQVRTSEKEGFI